MDSRDICLGAKRPVTEAGHSPPLLSMLRISGVVPIGNACYHSVQNLLSSRLLSKNLKIKIYKTVILSVVLYGCETWSLTLREGKKLRV